MAETTPTEHLGSTWRQLFRGVCAQSVISSIKLLSVDLDYFEGSLFNFRKKNDSSVFTVSSTRNGRCEKNFIKIINEVIVIASQSDFTQKQAFYLDVPKALLNFLVIREIVSISPVNWMVF